MTKSEAAEKIKKLLKQSGRTEAEADTAQILAAALAEKHGIDIAALDAAEERKRVEITHKAVGSWAKVPPEADYAAMICQEHFEVSTITTGRFIQEQWICVEEETFVGTTWHIEVAEYVFHFLIKEFRWQWNHRAGRSKNRKQFIWGCYLATQAKLRSRFKRDEKTLALEISFKAKRDAYMKEHWPDAVNSDVAPQKKTGKAMERGWLAGRDIEIRPGVKAGEQRQQGALPGFESRLLTNGGH